MSVNKIVVNGVELGKNGVVRGSLLLSHSMLGETLSADTFSFTLTAEPERFLTADEDGVELADEAFLLVAPMIDPEAQFHAGDEVLLYVDSEIVGKYYLKSIKQVSPRHYELSAASIIDVLSNATHYGGIYVGVPASTVLGSILENVDYTLSPEVSGATVTGYLPVASKRDNLQQVLLATGGAVCVSPTGTMLITAMSSAYTGEFDTGRLYVGGTLETTDVVTAVQVTEHNYFESQETETLYDDGVDGTETIVFDQPHHGLVCIGGIITESGANYAKISALGPVKLTGKKYIHVTRLVTAGTIRGDRTDNIKTVGNAYLVNPQIATAVAERVYQYSQCRSRVRQDVLFGTERAGDLCKTIHPYTGAVESATITEMDVSLSAKNKAVAELLVGYVPPGVISGFKNYAVLTGSGTWTVPAGISKIRAIACGAGGGGTGGKNGLPGTRGEDGATGYYSSATAGIGGPGGDAGTSGTGGKVFEIGIDVSAGAAFTYACGAPGVGGSSDGGKGTAGSDTVFGSYSSAYGRKYPYGYYEAKSGLTIGKDGVGGVPGGGGGAGNRNTDFYEGQHAGYPGESVSGYLGGAGAAMTKEEGSDSRRGWIYAGGGGGGAANGAVGGSGLENSGGSGAPGGAGASGQNYGQGGGAGNGGGGGGGGGACYFWNSFETSMSTAYSGPVGSGGPGGAGGAGGAGCIIIYY
jgi:hypothetical protein